MGKRSPVFMRRIALGLTTRPFEDKMDWHSYVYCLESLGGRIWGLAFFQNLASFRQISDCFVCLSHGNAWHRDGACVG